MPDRTERHAENLAMTRLLVRIDRLRAAYAAGETPDPADHAALEAFLRDTAEDYHRVREERTRVPALRLAGVCLEPWLVSWLRREHGFARQTAFEILTGLGARTPDRQLLARALADYARRVRFTLRVENECLLGPPLRRAA